MTASLPATLLLFQTITRSGNRVVFEGVVSAVRRLYSSPLTASLGQSARAAGEAGPWVPRAGW